MGCGVWSVGHGWASDAGKEGATNTVSIAVENDGTLLADIRPSVTNIALQPALPSRRCLLLPRVKQQLTFGALHAYWLSALLGRDGTLAKSTTLRLRPLRSSEAKM